MNIRAAGPSQDANWSPLGGSAAAQAQAWGHTFAPPGRPKARIGPPCMLMTRTVVAAP